MEYLWKYFNQIGFIWILNTVTSTYHIFQKSGFDLKTREFKYMNKYWIMDFKEMSQSGIGQIRNNGVKIKTHTMRF